MKKLFTLAVMALLLAPVRAEKNRAANYAELKKHFTALININTAQPEGNELQAARYLYGALDDEHIDWDIFESTPGRAALMARLRAQKPTDAKPLILVSHLDTISAEESLWLTPPFAATEKNGEIYGLGAADCKDLTAINLMTLIALKRSGIPLSRDVILLATPDEESGSALGMKWLLERHLKDIAPNGGYALNEGGGVIAGETGRPLLVFVETSGKMYLDLKLTAYGAGGHAALPTQERGAIYSLAGALTALEKLKLPVRLTPAAEKFLRAIYPIQGPDGKTTFDLFFSQDAQKSAAGAAAITLDPFFNTQLRDTFAPTLLRAGQDSNTIPSEASAILNCRLLYNTEVDAFMDIIRKTVEPYGVKVSVAQAPQLPYPPAMTQDDDLYKAITSAAAAAMPGAAVIGGMIPGTTDSEYLRRAGITAYGLGAPKSYADLNDAHAPNEKMRLDSLYRYFDFVYAAAREFATVPPSDSAKPAPLAR